jgi:ABC-2 type transport system permease protein
MMTAFLAHFNVEFITGIRNKTLFLMNYLFPLLFYGMVGLIMTQINPMFTPLMVPAMVIFATLVTTILGIPDPLVTARESGIFRSYKVTGIPAFSILVIPALSTVLHLTVVTLIIVLTAPILFDAPAPSNWLAFIGVYLVVAFAHAGLGVLIGVISPSSRLTVLLAQVIFLPSMLIGGLMVPYEMLPANIGKIAQIFPATQAMNALQGLAMGATADFDPLRSVIILFMGGLVAFSLALFLFSWDNKNTSRKANPLLGLLAIVPYLISLI